MKNPNRTSTESGVDNVPVVVETLVFDEGQITCPSNGLRPKWNGMCHSLTGNAGRTVAIIREGEDMGEVPVRKSYQEVAGTLNPGGHPGSYNGQDAYNDLLITGSEGGDAMQSVVRRLTPLE